MREMKKSTTLELKKGMEIVSFDLVNKNNEWGIENAIYREKDGKLSERNIRSSMRGKSTENQYSVSRKSPRKSP